MTTCYLQANSLQHSNVLPVITLTLPNPLALLVTVLSYLPLVVWSDSKKIHLLFVTGQQATLKE